MSSLADISAKKISRIIKKKPDKNDTPLSYKKNPTYCFLARYIKQ